MHRFLFIAALIAPTAAGHGQAQSVAKPGLPPGSMARADDKGDMAKVSFAPMSRGWHVTTGPIHAIFYRPENAATGNTTAVVVDWTTSSAIKTVPAGDKNVENIFKIQARPDSVLVSLNDVVVATRPRSELNVDGVTGFRINHSLNFHIAGLTVAQAK